MVSENFNIEAPNYLSKESEVLIYARQDSQCIDCFQAFLPVHYRYHRPHSKDGETFIVLNNPDLLMYCDQGKDCKSFWRVENKIKGIMVSLKSRMVITKSCFFFLSFKLLDCKIKHRYRKTSQIYSLVTY